MGALERECIDFVLNDNHCVVHYNEKYYRWRDGRNCFRKQNTHQQLMHVCVCVCVKSAYGIRVTNVIFVSACFFTSRLYLIIIIIIGSLSFLLQSVACRIVLLYYIRRDRIFIIYNYQKKNRKKNKQEIKSSKILTTPVLVGLLVI